MYELQSLRDNATTHTNHFKKEMALYFATKFKIKKIKTFIETANIIFHFPM
jgi:hypothetical protein